MSYLIDTNVISELTRPRPAKPVVAWFESTPDMLLHMSVLTVGEIRKGVEAVSDAPRRERLRLWLEVDLPAWFEERLLPVSLDVAEIWGQLLAEAKQPVPAIDSLIAATALCHGLRVVTRNEGDFVYPGLQVVNPWST